MPGRIQIPRDLFELIAAYIFDHPDPGDSRYRKIITGINAKQEALERHEVYTEFKTARDKGRKELARQIYLVKAGINKDFRW